MPGEILPKSSLLLKPLLPIENSSPKIMGTGDWVQLENISYKDDKGIERKWERCIRTKPEHSSIDAIDIHAILLTPIPKVLLVIQYRPAIECYCVEFPSGLIDPSDKDPIDSAQRELKEETGYLIPKEQFELINVPVAYEPGLTNSCCYVVNVTIDTTQLIEAPIQQLEPDEWSLQTISLPVEGLLESLIGLVKSYNGLLIIDSRLHSFAIGLEYSKFKF
ncbi:NUDIX hydrolase domain-like protein [Cokeromyces recurvatus]|uniref:NUDIX hydrolase domain-like protein n=1 Tax=Cokeromyces recurvatus TaxID=90255 RepID=UPI00222001EA|nr:NUDIX hydrolase domain-like protein [Cokeromyces recurvatus]KAI7901220.1 NUDIX hydrolase domain-like protein [Cokeromyces recurvatus]